jgi:signal transduction histidine kinase
MNNPHPMKTKSGSLELARLRKKWHDGPSQKLLGLAFGTKLLAMKLELIDNDLAKEAERIAELTNQAVGELQEIFSTEKNK